MKTHTEKSVRQKELTEVKKELSRLWVLGDLCVICDDLLAKY